MIHANWFEPETIRALGWTLLHFVWQGAALAMALYVVTAFCASARTRYIAALSTLILMAVCPAATFVFLEHRGNAALPMTAIKEVVRGVAAVAGSQAAFSSEAGASGGVSVDWLRWCVAAWLLGVVTFGARALGGWIVIERLRREKIEPLAESMRQRCLELQQRLGLRQRVRYFQSHLMDSPAVIGWFRPVVLLPIAALTGLSPRQLEAVILHELAHIKRWDSFVNLFQIAVETILFYHPAVWWVSRFVRTERENCCDDIAVSVCGNPGDYARALALLETWRATPALAMAATGGALKARIARLIGFEKLSVGVPRAGLAAVGLICAASALLAASGFRAAYLDPHELNAASAQSSAVPEAPAAPADVAQEASPPSPPSEPARPSEPRSTGSYIGDLRAVGLTNLTVDQLLALKVQGVTADYVRQLHNAGLHPSVDQLIAMKVQGISPEYVHEMHALGLNADIDQLIAMKVQGISPEYVHDMRAAGLNPNLEQLIAMKVQGISPEYVRNMRAAGLTNLSTEQFIAAKVQGISPEFIEKARSHGFKNLSFEKLLALKNAGIF